MVEQDETYHPKWWFIMVIYHGDLSWFYVLNYLHSFLPAILCSEISEMLHPRLLFVDGLRLGLLLLRNGLGDQKIRKKKTWGIPLVGGFNPLEKY